MAVQNDGKIVVIANDESDGFILRFNANGSLDTSFGTKGVITIHPTYSHGFGWVTMGGVDVRRSDNRIVVTSTDNAHGGVNLWEVVLLAPDGHEEWGAQGPPMPNDGSFAGNVVLDGDDSILVSGSAILTNDDGSSSYHSILVRYPPPKSSAQETWIDLGDNGAGQLLPLPDGDLLMQDGSHIKRLNHNLTTDTSFGGGGAVDTALDSFSMAISGDGKIVVDGGHRISPSNPDAKFHSLRVSGDQSFATATRKSLRILGTSGNDRIKVSKAVGIISVALNGTTPYLFSSARIKRLSIDAGSGDDVITLSKTVPTTSVNGGDGNDTLAGKRRKDRISSVEHA
jgi:hypothetical protein